jgi:hypothetical protein
MTKSFVRPHPAAPSMEALPPSSREQIVAMARQAGLNLPDKLMDELCASFPAFEAMVRRLPRMRPKSDEPAHIADVARLAAQVTGDQAG